MHKIELVSLQLTLKRENHIYIAICVMLIQSRFLWAIAAHVNICIVKLEQSQMLERHNIENKYIQQLIIHILYLYCSFK